MRDGAGSTILVVGDSHADMMRPTFTVLAEKYDLTLAFSARGACPWMRGAVMSGWPPSHQEVCTSRKADLYDTQLGELAPDMVFLFKRGLDASGNRLVGASGSNQNLEPSELAFELGRSTTAAFPSQVSTIVLVEPLLEVSGDQRKCLAYAEFVEECAAPARPLEDSLDAVYEALALEFESVRVIDLDGLLCPASSADGLCDAVADGVTARKNASHISPAYAAAIAEDFEALLAATGLLELLLTPA